MADWRDLAAAVDAAVQRQFGERVRIVPRRVDGFDVPQPDPAREPFEVAGVLGTLNDMAMGLSGDHAGSPFRGRIALQNVALHVKLGDLAGKDVQLGDLVEPMDRPGESFEINRIVNEAAGFTMFSLLRVD
ncbi:hypothetical protein PQJ75_00705 [Rhodoplanes sp. TEM]|uniref:Uncharacterized protein n=1 Tax=Rhodoplanes tepidamans TaxID=200616 RepID=A0ABT5J565_RHOTP|nr:MULTISPECIES: hypothetical protein [Rhodoplanes]MDC7784772.1 hypothetical protein [Rhodoplanes tepidamans]MDC7982239.1 hypothetical protein [Rhodoplanes sp. TEM]MDQ0356246.1 hypothetical protein [Rhodoplanes tepidamans]